MLTNPPCALQDAKKDHEQFGYYCILVPYTEFEAKCRHEAAENDGGDADEEREPEDIAEEEYKKQFTNKKFMLKPAAEAPDHKWITTWETWKLINHYQHRADFVNPENFGMVKARAASSRIAQAEPPLM